jgi:hypothetical protein
MAARSEGGYKEFVEFLKTAPSLDEATDEDVTELTGIVARGSDGKFAITTGEGQTYELDAEAVRRFRADAGTGLTPVVTIRITASALKDAVLRPIKPVFKDIVKDPIKDIISDQGTGFGKDIHTDPIVDKPTHKDIKTDPLADKTPHKDFTTDPLVDKAPPKDLKTDFIPDKIPHKDLHKDPLQDPLDTGWADSVGKPAGDPVDIPDPAGGVINPAAGFNAAATPFVMQTPHHAAAHLVAQQMGVPQTMRAGGGAQLKGASYDTIKEVSWGETVKEPALDTRKEMIFDTRKEMVWDTWVETGPYTIQEGVIDPGQVFGPQPEPWAVGPGAVAGFRG